MEAAPLRPPFRSRGSPAVDSFSSEIAEEAEVDEHRNQSIRCQRIVARGLIAAGSFEVRDCVHFDARECPERHLNPISEAEKELVALTFASWNQIDDLLRRLEALRSAAGSA